MMHNEFNFLYLFLLSFKLYGTDSMLTTTRETFQQGLYIFLIFGMGGFDPLCEVKLTAY